MTLTLAIVSLLVVLRWIAQLWLEWLNQRHVLAHAHAMPAAFEASMDPATYARSIEYTLAKSRFSQLENTFGMLILLVLILTGVLPLAYNHFCGAFGSSAWSLAAFLFLIGIGLSLLGLPLDWYAPVMLEER